MDRKAATMTIRRIIHAPGFDHDHPLYDSNPIPDFNGGPYEDEGFSGSPPEPCSLTPDERSRREAASAATVNQAQRQRLRSRVERGARGSSPRQRRIETPVPAPRNKERLPPQPIRQQKTYSAIRVIAGGHNRLMIVNLIAPLVGGRKVAWKLVTSTPFEIPSIRYGESLLKLLQDAGATAKLI